ncbi:MAG: RecX family transcriptional regulator [Bacteroidales bacterium]|nr:RecX family transcriptional regulator [Bacteroidales bacterium]MBN2758630.1 RecX family transcriptional regulator [Bacteroidales bacterium]
MLKKITKEEALKKSMNICAKQEKCKFDIKEKLFKLGLEKNNIFEIVEQLEKENFINEERYCKFYVRDKYKIAKWGRKKIEFSLKQKQIPDEIIQNSLSEINQEIYIQVFENEMIKKQNQIKTDDFAKQKSKLLNFAQSRGYEADLIFKIIDKIIKK